MSTGRFFELFRMFLVKSEDAPCASEAALWSAVYEYCLQLTDDELNDLYNDVFEECNRLKRCGYNAFPDGNIVIQSVTFAYLQNGDYIKERLLKFINPKDLR